MKFTFTAIIALLITSVFPKFIFAQTQKIEVLTLGTFHFNFPNLDEVKTEKSNQIDVLEPKYQKEINVVVEKLSKFKPTIIVIERQPNKQQKIDSLYQLYLQGKFPLQRHEEQQIGFRLAKQLGLKKLYCVDEWGDFLPIIDSTLDGKDTIEIQKFVNFFETNPDKAKKVIRKDIYKSKGILEELKMLNEPKNVKQSLGNYLIGPFKYEITEGDFFGTNFEIGRWFSRNLKIFRNIQRINASPSDKILVIFGADHLNLLNIFFESSPEYTLANTNDYLK